MNIPVHLLDILEADDTIEKIIAEADRHGIECRRRVLTPTIHTDEGASRHSSHSG